MELNKCSECGSEAEVIRPNNGFTFMVRCMRCDWHTENYDDFYDAIKVWNIMNSNCEVLCYDKTTCV